MRYYVSPDGTQTVPTTVPVEGATLRRRGYTVHDDAESAEARSRHVQIALAARSVTDDAPRPKANARKQTWVDFATAAGVSATLANGMTRDELADAFSTGEDESPAVDTDVDIPAGPVDEQPATGQTPAAPVAVDGSSD